LVSPQRYYQDQEAGATPENIYSGDMEAEEEALAEAEPQVMFQETMVLTAAQNLNPGNSSAVEPAGAAQYRKWKRVYMRFWTGMNREIWSNCV
jgi:hypothetical protein